MKPSRIGLRGGPWTASCALALLFQVSAAQAAGPSPACKAAYQDAQRQEHEGHLVEARKFLGGCARAACGKAMLVSCTQIFNRLETEVPTIVLGLSDDKRTDIEVKIDGETVTSKIDGEAIPVNPGLHEFTFAADGTVFATRKVMIVEGAHERAIVFTMHAADNNVEHPSDLSPAEPDKTDGSGGSAAPTGPPSPSATPVSGITEVPVSAPAPHVPAAVPWVLTGIGAAGLGVSAWLFSTRRRDRVDVAVDSAGVGVGALAVAIVLFATSHGSREVAPPSTSVLVDASPLRGGAYASIRAAF